MPKRNPVVSDSEVYEIKPLIWKELSPCSFWTKEPPYDYMLNVYLSPNGDWWNATNVVGKFQSQKQAMEAAEKAYQKQLRKALRRVRS